MRITVRCGWRVGGQLFGDDLSSAETRQTRRIKPSGMNTGPLIREFVTGRSSATLESKMKYECGTEVMLGDEIMVGHGPRKEALARVVAIGTGQAIDGIDQEFYSWAKGERIVDKDTVVVEWISANPLANDDPHRAPVGNYMTINSLCCETFVRRGQSK